MNKNTIKSTIIELAKLVKGPIIGLAMITSCYTGFHFLTKDVESELKQHTTYNKIINIDEKIIPPLYKTIDELNYISKGGATILFTHTSREERYPNPKNAKEIINNILKQLGNKNNLDDKLEMIYDSLPDQNDIRIYKEKNVDNSTFVGQKTSIESIIKDIKVLRNDCINEIPNNLISKIEKERQLNDYIMFLCTMVTAFCGAYLLRKYVHEA